MSNQVIEEIRKAEADAEKVKLAAREKAAALCEAARAHMDTAVNAVVWGIVEKCQ